MNSFTSKQVKHAADAQLLCLAVCLRVTKVTPVAVRPPTNTSSLPGQHVELFIISETFLLIKQFTARHASQRVVGRRGVLSQVVSRTRCSAGCRHRVHGASSPALCLQAHLEHVRVTVLRRTDSAAGSE